MNLEQMPSSYSTIGELANYLRRIVPRISVSWNVEHSVDGRHRIPWESPEFSANDFYAVSGTWTVIATNVIAYQYATLGPLTFVNFNVQYSTLAGGLGTELRVRIPGRLRAASKEFTGGGWISSDVGVNGPAALQVFTRTGAVADHLGLFKTDLSNWVASAGDVGVRGFLVFDAETY
jgi:hypothetical protein